VLGVENPHAQNENPGPVLRIKKLLAQNLKIHAWNKRPSIRSEKPLARDQIKSNIAGFVGGSEIKFFLCPMRIYPGLI
jgi:hypothetical protein